MFSSSDDERGAGTGGGDAPGDGMTPITGADRWSYLPFAHDDASDEHRITLVRDDGIEVAMTLPDFVGQGDELREIALQVIRARERWRDLKGLGG